MEFSCFCFFNCFTEASFELQVLKESKSRDSNLLLAVGRAFHTIVSGIGAIRLVSHRREKPDIDQNDIS